MPSATPAQEPRDRSGRSTGRLAAVQALYQIEATQDDAERVIKDIIAGRVGGIALAEDSETGAETIIALTEPDGDLFIALVRAARGRGEDIDGMIKGSLSADWPWERLEMTLRAILRAGVAELLTRADIPAGVTITEFVDIGHAFYNGPEPRMINAVLDRVARALGRADAGRAAR